MARIRTIKPEFWDSPDTAKASLRARLLYISMWNLADDYGVGDGNFRRIIGFAFPNDEIGVSEIPRLLAEVSRTFSVMFYEHEGRPYYWIPAWETHQRTEKRAKQRVPFPETPKTLTSSGQIDGVGKSAASVGSSGAGTGEQGNRGKGTGEEEPAPPTADAAAPDPAQEATKDAYERVGKAFKYVAVLAIAKWAIKERGTNPEHLADAFVNIYGMGKPITKQIVGQYLDGKLNQPQQRMDHSARGLAKGIAMLQAYDAQQTQPFELEA